MDENTETNETTYPRINRPTYARDNRLDFAKQLGRRFAINAAASAGTTAGVMIVLRFTLRKTGVQLSKITTNS